VSYHPYEGYRVFKGLIPLILILIPLTLSAFTHLWNPIGFPYIHGDEAHYLRRAMHVLQGLGPQEAKTEFEHHFDHPYFGQLFLGGVFGAIGYPHFINISSSSFEGLKWSVEQLYLYPRILMGILAVVDTFLIYKITERRYSRNAAFIAAVLFAVTPLTWLTRRVVLESIYLPLILSSILCVLYLSYTRFKSVDNSKNKIFDSARSIIKYLPSSRILTITSGVLLGLAIFTKITAIMIIPLLLYLLFMKSRGNSLKALRLWILPVIIIPMIWPIYALISGQLQDWVDGVTWQGDRDGRGLYRSYLSIFRMDPLLCVIGISSVILITAIKRDVFFLLWLVPFLLFYSLLPFIQHFHWIFVLPLLCIASGVCISDLLDILSKRKASLVRVGLYGTVSALFIFGFVSTVLLININLNGSLFTAQALIIKSLPYTIQKDHSTTENVILVGSNWMQSLSWIPEYIFSKGHSFKEYIEKNLPIENEDSKKILLLVDRMDQEGFSLTNQVGSSLEKERLYNNTHAIAEISEKSDYYKKYRDQYPYTSVHENRGIEKGKITIMANY
jgi:4-amino-4-deoxy-L-arabinose transferase-like glycosyltransferase